MLVQRYSSADTAPDNRQGRTNRPALLKAIVGHVPPGIVQYGQRVVDLRQEGSTTRLVFEDGQASHEEYDLVVAADGIYSTIRSRFWPNHKVGYNGAVAYRCLLHKSAIAGIEGLHDDTSAWRSNDSVVFLSEVGSDIYGIVIIRPETAEYASSLRWETSIGTEALQQLRRAFNGWDPVVARVLAIVDNIQAYPLDSGRWLTEITRNGNVAFVGDAAHPTAGAYGVGAAMGFGDGWALSRALEATRSRNGPFYGAYDVRAALDIFQETRAPFLLRVERQMSIDPLDKEYIAAAGDDEDEWIRRFKERNTESHWLTDHDVELEVQRVIAGYRTERTSDQPLTRARL